MTDVAELAGVSHQTVSRVINDHPGVRDQTRQRVNKAISELGYRPNQAAKTLATGRSGLIGLVADDAATFGQAALVTALEQQAAEAGFAVVVTRANSLDRDALSAALDRHLDKQVTGIVVIAPFAAAENAIANVASRITIVTIDGDPTRSTSLIAIDHQAGAQLATQCLLDAGHETVWHIAGPADRFDSESRIRGWTTTLTAAGAEVPPLLRGDWSAASGYQAGRTLARMPEVSAIFAANDHVALGVLRALHEKDRSVPEDVSVVGFDDVAEAAFYTPPLTTVRPDFADVAHRTLAVLMERAGRPAESFTRQIISPALVLRCSVAPGPRRRIRRIC